MSLGFQCPGIAENDRCGNLSPSNGKAIKGLYPLGIKGLYPLGNKGLGKKMGTFKGTQGRGS